MEELIAKRYIKAIKNSSNAVSLEMVAAVFSTLAESFKDAKFRGIINNPGVTKDQKSNILLDAVKNANSKEVENLIKLLVENNRLSIIPAMAEELRKELSNMTKNYKGVVYSDNDLDTKLIQDLSSGLSKKFDSNIALTFIKDDFNGIKVDVEDLGIEINFSKTRINSQIIEHILKAI
jgi:F-type H+-transporting ATPase subunit delta